MIIEGKKYPYPDDWVKPNDWLFEELGVRRVTDDALKLPGGWIVIDGTLKLDESTFTNVYPDDPYGDILERLVAEGKIQNVFPGSRFNFTWHEARNKIFPEITRVTHSKREFQHPTSVVYNTIGNLFHKEWGKDVVVQEWLEENGFNDVHEFRLYCGHGLGTFGDYPNPARFSYLGFRPMVSFAADEAAAGSSTAGAGVKPTGAITYREGGPED